jgi:hypothetical protein
MIVVTTIFLGLALFLALQAWEELQILRRSYRGIAWMFKNPEQPPPPWTYRQPNVQTSQHLYTLLE